MENLHNKLKLERDLEKFQIEKSTPGTEAFLIQSDIDAGVSQPEIMMKSQSGVYANNGVFKSDYDDLEKAIKADQVVRGVEDFNITKKGSDIKAALENGKKEIGVMKEKCLLKMGALKKEIGEEPTKDFCDNHSYMCDGYKDRLTDLPKEYDMNSGYEKTINPNETVLYADGVNNKPKVDNSRQYKYDYNDKLYTYCRLCIDLMKLETTIEAIVEKKTYKMSVDLATKMNL